MKLPTIWTNGKTEVGRVKKEKKRSEKIREEKEREERKRRCAAQESRKVGSLKRRLQSQLARMRDEKLHAVVARSAFGSKKPKNTSRSEHYWKLTSRKSARRCGAKHICKSKVLKN